MLIICKQHLSGVSCHVWLGIQKPQAPVYLLQGVPSEVGKTLGKILLQGLAARGGPERTGVATAAPERYRE